MAKNRRNIGVDTVAVSAKDMDAGASRALSGPSGSSVFSRAIVIEIITTPNDLIDLFDEEPEEGDAESENPFHNKIKNTESAKKAPRGSLIVKELTDNASDTYICAYPFFQSHIMLPAHVGEQVWLFVDGEDYFWLSRIAGSNISEDVNFTHVDRDLQTPIKLGGNAKDKSDQEKGVLKRLIGLFNNGAGGDAGGAKNAPEGADTKSVKLNAIFTREKSEPIPRFTPRPGDLVLQGSNNTLIALSTDRGWNKDAEDFSISNAHEEALDGTGSIDIVAGRGMQEDPSADFIPSDEESEGTEPTRTGFRTIVDELGGVENNKLAKQNEESINFAEGDPDFHLDASRVFVSMNSKVDERLTIAAELPVLAEGDLEDKEDASVVLKTNELRIIARENGSVRIVKEKGEEGLGASIIIQPDGTIHVTGEKIFIGKSGGEDGKNEGPGPGGMQPYIKFSVMKEYLEELHASIDKFCQTTLTHTTPGYGAPSPQLNQAVGDLKADMAANKPKIDQLQSERIFGE
tara:strand:+ start:6102 stop:7652 length:1551 start_codon:yes stop_codon:yes gene_type:complete